MFRKLTIAAAVTCFALIAVAANAGAVPYPVVHPDVVRAYSTDVYHITFRGQEVAYVAVTGDHDTDLDLYVEDENGNRIASDTDSTDRCIVRFTPRWTGSFTIRIVNLGSVYNRYLLETN
jgi:hypothetical protein